MSPSVSGESERCAMSYTSNMGAFTFFAKTHPGDVCGSNGLPLTPNSIAILGQSQILKTLQNPHLCEYLDVMRGKHERVIVVSEYAGTPLSRCADSVTADPAAVLQIAYQTASGLATIHRQNMVSNNLEPANILLDGGGNVKLFNYGLFHMTNGGEYVSFPIGNVRYMSPERVLGSAGNNPKGDSWCWAIIVTELLFKRPLWPTLNVSQMLRKILSLLTARNVLEKIARENDALHAYETMDPRMRDLLERCLAISLAERPTAGDILAASVFTNLSAVCGGNSSSTRVAEAQPSAPLLMRCPLKHIYFWWQLAGGDVHVELKRAGLIRSEAPILKMPVLSLLDGATIGPPRSRSHMFNGARTVALNLTNLTERLANVDPHAYFPLLHTPNRPYEYGAAMHSLPLVIRERDTEYQFYRVVLFRRLLQGYPHTAALIEAEAHRDVPPLLRGEVWACLLGVLTTDGSRYAAIDKETATPTDRQIDVDIPRCHQYDELLSSPVGHRKLKRLLKAWVTAHPQYVYWQGLDSLTAPFLYLNFCNEERAFLSLYKFIPKYLHWFFLRDNSAIIKEYLFKFSQLTAFHEPLLARHLAEINFIPELFAIPWFLTMFSHVFPLHKIIHLWDKLILGDASYPLFVGISVLQQLKNTLLASGFNECILLFSDLPDIVMETCVVQSQRMYAGSPKSISFRKHVLRAAAGEPGEFDIADIALRDLQAEMCPRISASDVLALLRDRPDDIAVLDLRSASEFRRAHLAHSVNVPFAAVQLADARLEALGADVPAMQACQLAGRVVVVVSCVHENAVVFSKFLVDCGVALVCTLHNGFNILHTVVPNILVTS